MTTTISLNDFSGGYTRENAQDNNFVNGSKNVDIYGNEDKGFGFEDIKGNVQFANISGKPIYNLWEYPAKDDKYLLAHAGDTLQIYNEKSDSWKVLKSGLTASVKDASLDTLEITTIVDGKLKTRYLAFFCNETDTSFIFEKDTKPQVQTVNTIDIDGNVIKSKNCIAFDGRIWLAQGTSLKYSVQNDPYTFNTINAAGTFSLGSKFKSFKVLFGGLLVSTLNGFIFIKSNGDGTYSSENLSTNYALNQYCMSKFGKQVLYFSETGLYSIDTTQAGVPQTGSNLSYPIDKELTSYGLSTREDAQLLEIVADGRNESWLHIPYSDDVSIVYILRFAKGNQKSAYWLPPRYQQRVNCYCVFKNKILSGTSDGKILREMQGNDFDGTFINSVAKLSKINFGDYTYEVECEPILLLNNEVDNYFKTTVISSGNDEDTQIVDPTSSLSGLWATDDEDDTDGMLWAEDDTDTDGGIWAVVNLNKIDLGTQTSSDDNYECSLQFQFETTEAGEHFSIHCIDLTEIEKETE